MGTTTCLRLILSVFAANICPGDIFTPLAMCCRVPNFCMLHGIMNCSDGSPCTAYPGGPCTGFGGDGTVASANSPLPGLKMAMRQYAEQGVSMDKIVLVRYTMLSRSFFVFLFCV